MVETNDERWCATSTPIMVGRQYRAVSPPWIQLWWDTITGLYQHHGSSHGGTPLSGCVNTTVTVQWLAVVETERNKQWKVWRVHNVQTQWKVCKVHNVHTAIAPPSLTLSAGWGDIVSC